MRFTPDPPCRRPLGLLFRLAGEFAVRFDVVAPVGFSCVAYETTVLPPRRRRAVVVFAPVIVAVMLAVAACASGDQGGSPDAAADGPAYRLYPQGGQWELVEAYDPAPGRTLSAGAEPTLDWYAEYEAPPAASPRRVRLSGHGGSVDEVVEPMGSWPFEPVRVADADGLVFAAPAGSEPTVVAFGAGPALSLMALSYELSSDELIRWAGDLVPVSEAEWVAAGGRVDR